MTSLTISFVAAAAAALVVTPLARWAAWRTNALDYADGQRKLHTQPVPHLGGIALLVALVIGSLVGTFPNSLLAASPLLLSAAMMCAVGWLDDRHCLRVRWKLFGQVLATLPLVVSGQIIDRLECGGFVFDLGWWAIPLSIVWYTACANAMNFVDGVDGLASTIGLVIAASLAILSDGLGNDVAALLAIVMAGGLAGFLLHNWQPATIYLGDAGSMTIGLWFAAIAVNTTHSPDLGCRLVVLIALMGLPLADVALAIIRRMLNGRHFWLADREHIHHCLLDRRWTAPSVVFLLAGVTAAGGAVAYAAAVYGRELLAWAALALLAVALNRFGMAGVREVALLKQAAAKCLVDAFAAICSGRKSGPSPEQLDALAVPAAWALFLADIEHHEVDELELTLEGGEADCRHHWCRPMIHSSTARSWSLDVFVIETDGTNCRLRATTRKRAAWAPLDLFLLGNTLRVYAEHWAKNSADLGDALRHDASLSLTTRPTSGDDLSKAA